MKYSNYKRIHFIGIGGIGMSAIAYVLIKRGALVSGSDVEESSITEKLKKIGAKIYIGHKKTNIIEPLDLVIYSSCIRKNNPEIQAAQTLGIPTALRGEVLAWLMNEKIGISIAGTHGKTTTTSLIGTILKGTDLKPTILVGGEVPSLGGNAVFGEGNYLVAESDESDGSFLALRPTYSVVTNLDEDHLDYHKDKKGLVKAFIQYVSNTKQDGCLIYWYDEPQKHSLLKAFNGRKVSFGLDKGADISAGNIELQKDFTVFDCYKSGERLGEIKLPLGGKHNCRNALAAIAVAIDIGVDFKEIKKSLESFSGVKRRFQIKGTYNGVMLVEDYAHHPTEIESVLAQARLWRPNRLISVFQPHRYTRTLQLKEEFGKCFNLCDHLILTDIYPAGEKPIKGVDGKTICHSVDTLGKNKSVVYLSKDKITRYISRIVKEGDSVLILGAGNINRIVDDLAKELEGRA